MAGIKVLATVAIGTIGLVGETMYSLYAKPSAAEVDRRIETRLSSYTLERQDDVQKRTDRALKDALAPVMVELRAIKESVGDLKTDVRSISR